MKFTRDQIGGILAARHGHTEGVGSSATFDFHLKVTPEALEGIMRGYFVSENGTKARLAAVDVGDDGYAEPLLEIVA